ncbi:MAG: NAD-dependent protein deacylase, partial [Cetobacterium sp.]
IDAIKKADTLIVAGTSLTVYPAAYYIQYFKGKNLVIINADETKYDQYATLVIRDSFAEVMSYAIQK